MIGHNSTQGLQVADNSWWRYLYYSFEYLRMPLFTAISGFVYALKPVTREQVTGFIKGKSRRILLPFISVATLQYLLNAFVPDTNSPKEIREIWKIYLFSYGQFWFLQALFLVFLTVVVLEVNNITTKVQTWLISITIAFLILFLGYEKINIDLFSFKSYIYLLPFFLLGIGLNRFREILLSRKNFIYYLTILLIGIIIQQLNWFGRISISDNHLILLEIFIGITGIWMLFYIRRPNKFLAELGFYSYGIYLFHIFGTAGSRIISTWLGIENHLPLFITGLIFGLGLPIVIKLVLLKNAVLRRIFLGLK